MDNQMRPAGGRLGTLHMLCGRIAAGKSTLAMQLVQQPNTVLLSEDHLLARLYPGEIRTLDDYARRLDRLRNAISQHVEDLLLGGVSVVLDFQANTRRARAWMRSLAEECGADHRLHYLTTSKEVCKARLRERNAAGKHEYQVSEADFDAFDEHFVPPEPSEGFNLIEYR